ncbi:SCF ubiquitin ligase complex subunit [Mortierella sp. AD094]|nr:SCF ubiquitin ligase complex subunit [Mortierella sp. AD094]
MLDHMDMDMDHDGAHISSSSSSDRSSSSSPFPDSTSTTVSVPSSKSTTPGAELPLHALHVYDTLPGAISPSYIDLAKSSASLWTASASSSSSSLSSAHLLTKSASDVDLDLPATVPDSTQSIQSDNDDSDSNDYRNISSNNESNAPANPANAANASSLQQYSSVQRHQAYEQELMKEQQEQGLNEQTIQHSHNPYPAMFPSELILHIFKFLATPQDLRSAILVCKLWCSCGMDLLWSRPSLLSLPLVEKMCNTMTLDRSETLFPYPDYVRRLNFSFLAQDLTDDILVRFDSCKRLERLLLPGSNKTTEDGLKQILTVGRGLYSLDMSEIPAVTDSVLEHVANHCPKLHTLYLTGCSAITDESVVKLAANCPSLKRIKLGQCNLLTDRSILALTKNCPQLMEIDVTNCNLMTDTAIQSVFKTLPQVRDINMTLFANLTDHAFSFIPIGPPASSKIRFDQLRVLNLTSCVLITDETLARIIPAASRLRNLTLTKCDRITDASANAIKVLGKHLHYLHLGHCSKLTDKAIATLTQHCTRIRYLDLACCSKLTDAAVFAMAQLPKLRRIGLVKCSNITDHGIYAMLVSQIVPQTLERVHLSYCIHLSDTAVAALVSQCSKLTHLSVTGVPAFMSPKYQKFCRVPPSEFTAHQREVFCVFSGKGVRELRQYMQEHPTVPSSTLSSIQRSYRIMGSTVASMVAGGQHSSAILAHLGFTLRETENHIHNLAVQNAAAIAATSGAATAAGVEIGEEPTATLFALSTDNSEELPNIEALSTSAVDPSIQQQQENEALELEQQIEEMDQAEFDYAEMMMQQHLLLRRHHHRQQQRHQHRPRNHHPETLGSSSSHSSSAAIEALESSSAARQGSSSSLSSSSLSSSMLTTNTHLPMCPHHHHHQHQDQVPTLQAEIVDVRMATPGPMDQEEECTGSSTQVQGEAEGGGESGEGSSGGSGHGSPAEFEEEDVDEDVFADDDNEPSSRSRRR